MGRASALEEARKLKQALLKAGVPEVSIELRPGRPSTGDVWNNQFVVTDFAHHTVSRYSPTNRTPCLALVKNGRSDLSGPLCNGYGGWDLCARIICLGYANHSGFGGPMTVPSGVKKPPSYTIPKDNARKYAFGWEFEGGLNDADWDRVLNNPRGKGEAMNMREFMARCLNGTQDFYNLPLGAHSEHKTWAPTRKIDRLNYTKAEAEAQMQRFRAKDPPKPPDPPAADHSVRVVTANIKNNPDMPDQKVREDIKEVSKLGGWLLFQEIGEKADHQALEDILKNGWKLAFDDLATPIAVRDSFTINDRGKIKLHDGKANASPARYVCWLDLETPDGWKPILMNTHFVSGAWNSKPKPFKDWRKHMWKVSFATVQDRILKFNRQGRTVVIGADFNRGAMDKFTNTQRWLAKNGIDKIAICPAAGGGNARAQGDDRKVNLNSDHDALTVKIGWRS